MTCPYCPHCNPQVSEEARKTAHGNALRAQILAHLAEPPYFATFSTLGRVIGGFDKNTVRHHIGILTARGDVHIGFLRSPHRAGRPPKVAVLTNTDPSHLPENVDLDRYTTEDAP